MPLRVRVGGGHALRVRVGGACPESQGGGGMPCLPRSQRLGKGHFSEQQWEGSVGGMRGE